MDRIKALYKSFEKSERKALKNYLIAFHSKGENKPLELLRLIEKKPTISADILATKLYDNPRSKAFIMMKSRLYEKMTEFLSLSVNPGASKYNKEIPYFHDLIEYRKTMLTATILQEKNLKEQAKEYMEKAILLANKCNNPDLEIDVLLRVRASNFHIGKSFEEITLDIYNAIQRQERDINAVGIFNKFLALHNLRSSHDHKKVAFLESNIPDLEDALRQKYSPRAYYYLSMLKVHYFSIKEEYSQAKAATSDAVNVIRDNPGIRSRPRTSEPYFQLGLLELRFHNFDAAIEAYEEALRHLTPNRRAYIMTSIMQVYAYIFKGDMQFTLKKCQEIEEIFTEQHKEKLPLMVDLLAYLKSCVYFKLKDYSQSWHLLQQVSQLTFDKEGWTTGIRTFEIMILVDRGQLDLAGQKLENYRKHLARYPTEPRWETIYKILVGQERLGYTFKTFRNEAKLLNDLEEKYPWKHIGPEVICFHRWYRDKQR